jgi:uroporphyrinogen decarboxylase
VAFSLRERIPAAITVEALDRIPTDYWGTEEVTELLCSHLGCGTLLEMYDRLSSDGIFEVVASYIGPPPDLGADAYADEWDMRYKRQVHPSGGPYWEQCYYPLSEALTIEDVDAYVWSQADWRALGALTLQCVQYPDCTVKVRYSALFYYHNKLRRLDQSLMEPLLRPKFTHHLLRRLADTFYVYHSLCFEVTPGLVQISEVTDDVGSQTGLLISPALFRLFYESHLQRAIDLAKSFDLLIYQQDDGAIRPLISELVGAGTDVLNPIQWRCTVRPRSWAASGLGCRAREPDAREP